MELVQFRQFMSLFQDRKVSDHLFVCTKYRYSNTQINDRTKYRYSNTQINDRTKYRYSNTQINDRTKYRYSNRCCFIVFL
jgi:hypothetical protein